MPKLHTSVALTQGRREYMEDTYAQEENIMGVFDGHGGDQVAKMCASIFIHTLKQELKLTPEPSIAIREVFRKLDLVAKDLPRQMGCTAQIAFITNNRIWFANCGDSMAVVKLNNGETLLASQDHKVEYESVRIRKLGGIITYDDGCARINRMLNIGRSIGDYHLKQFVISTPFITSIPYHKNIEYIILGTDGLFDVFTKDLLDKEIQKTKAICREMGMNQKDTIDIITRTLVEQALVRGSMDNITVIYSEPEW
jgi:serine/threonine protein phosphatase PrpC